MEKLERDGLAHHWPWQKKLKWLAGFIAAVLTAMVAWNGLGFPQILVGPHYDAFNAAQAAQAKVNELQSQINSKFDERMVQVQRGLSEASSLVLNVSLNFEKKSLFEYQREARRDPDNETLAELIFKTQQSIDNLEEKLKTADGRNLPN